MYLSGILSDQLNRKIVIVAASVVGITGLSILMVEISYPLLLVGTAVFGVGAGEQEDDADERHDQDIEQGRRNDSHDN